MPRRDLREKVYLSLRRDLMSGAIPATERLGEERLAELYGVSRTPVREALARLLADGLVLRGHDGLHAYRPHVDDLAGLYELRQTLEIRGIVRAIDDVTLHHDAPAIVTELELWRQAREAPPTDITDVVSMDEQFHTTLLSASGNPALTVALRAVNAKVRPVRMVGSVSLQDIRAQVDEHITIAEAVLEGKLDEARTSLLAHLGSHEKAVIVRAEQAASMAGALRI
ncbi:GntR family transcriptional regulator [Rhodococcus sp. H36-A4]|uniref:GntR family transcriptional regulator n=1 Tax=Rhodococcus sp. H36-A4 TaxID=3004353 RepID=UPI0022AFEFFD|nr:GntR family transcriptional regulator [Rhodococcus sp. H36-A4]MCZ4079196.1 GntR family transcriptional regulator [Rhodococcus sp. H36-A4]